MPDEGKPDETPFDPEEELAKLRANFDQAKSFMPEFAQLLGTYGRALAEEGFDGDQILNLCMSLQTTFFQMGILMAPRK